METDCVEHTKTVCVKGTDGENIFITVPYYLPENSEIILALSKDNRVVELKTTPNKNETVYFVATKEFDSVKVMVWDSLLNMSPVCMAETVK